LKHDDDRDDDVEGGVPEKPGQKDEVELRRDHTDDRHQDEPDDDLRALRAAEQPEQQVEDHRHHGDVEHLHDGEMRDYLVELLEELAHPSAPKSSAMIAICAYSRFSAWSKTAERAPSITSSVTSSPRCAGRQCRKTAPGAASITAWFTWYGAKALRLSSLS